MLPGFQFRIKDLYTHPPLEAKTHDNVYSAFILKERQELEKRVEAAHQRAETERQRADAAEKRAEVAEKRAEEFIAKLRALGIEP